MSQSFSERIQTGTRKRKPKDMLRDAGCKMALNIDRQVRSIENPNSPFVSSLLDITRRGNNAALQSFSGTTASGFVQLTLPNGKTPYFLKFDGTNDRGILANTPDVDIIGTHDFAIGAVFMTESVLTTGLIISKNLSASEDSQYAIRIHSSGFLYGYINGVYTVFAPTGSIQPNTLYEVIVSRVDGILISKLNKVEKYNEPNIAELVSRPNFRLGVRSASADGASHVSYTNIYLGAVSVYYNGANGLNRDTVEKAFAKDVSNYI